MFAKETGFELVDFSEAFSLEVLHCRRLLQLDLPQAQPIRSKEECDDA